MNQHSRLPRQSVVSLSASALCGKNEFLLLQIQPVIAQITNPINTAKDLFLFFIIIFGCRHHDSGLFTAAVLWNSGFIQSYCTIQTTHFWGSIKRILLYFVSHSLYYISLCYGAFVFVFCFFRCLNCFQKWDNMGEWCTGMALHCGIRRSWECSVELQRKRGWHSGCVCPERNRRIMRGSSN